MLFYFNVNYSQTTAQVRIFILSFQYIKTKVEIHMFIIRQFTNADLDDVVNLWESCGLTRSWNNPETDIFRKVSHRTIYSSLLCKDEQLIGTLMGGYDGHRGWINYLAVHPHQQRLGIATALVQQLEAAYGAWLSQITIISA